VKPIEIKEEKRKKKWAMSLFRMCIELQD
jgi:hypothetical protein